ncbi:MAG: hypothetical protein CSA70_09840 [Rhodobacterales bacterium]|nr:MAG: hypothetical protein CSA70_09840 [Rhodobacterales bacterium]
MTGKASKPKPAKSARKRRGARPGRGTLMIIVSLLIASATIRMGANAGQALAKQGEVSKPVAEAPRPEPASCEPAEDLAAALSAIKARNTQLAQREDKLKARLQALAVADQEIQKKMASLQKAEEALRSTLALADSAAEDDIARLTSVYENMKPKDAADLFETMDPEFAAGFLGRMRPEAAAGIMTGLTPETAYTVSAILAGRNANVPKK